MDIDSLVSLPKLALQSLEACDIDIRTALLSNIVLTGGSTLFPNMTERFHREIMQLVPGVRVFMFIMIFISLVRYIYICNSHTRRPASKCSRPGRRWSAGSGRGSAARSCRRWARSSKCGWPSRSTRRRGSVSLRSDASSRLP